MNKFAGALLSPPDERDYIACMAYEDNNTPLPENFMVWQPPTENQYDTNNCVAQTIANIFECHRYKMLKSHKDFSVGFIYGSQNRTGMGMYLREGCRIAVEVGDIYREVFDSNEEMPKIKKMVSSLSAEIKENAQKAAFFVKLKTIEEIKRFIYKYELPVLACVDCWAFSASTGNHAMPLCGWKGEKVIFHNSWGKKKEYPELDSDEIVECWGIVFNDLLDFSDVTAEHWAYNAIMQAAYDNLLLGYPDNTFQPEKELTRAELAVLILRYLKTKK